MLNRNYYKHYLTNFILILLPVLGFYSGDLKNAGFLSAAAVIGLIIQQQLLIKNKKKLVSAQDKQVHDKSFNTGRASDLQIQLAHIGHEVRTPLHGIMGMLNMIKTEQDQAVVKQYTNTALHTCSNLLTVLNNNIDAARFEEQEIVLRPVPQSLLALCEDITNLHATNAVQKKLDFNMEFDPRLLGLDVTIDNLRLSQVLNNLINNAIKFTDAGSIKFWISRGKQTENSAVIRFTVQDSGIGISEDALTQLTTPFKQENKDGRNDGGSGLGLNISQKIVNAMGGHLHFKSTPGSGTWVYFDINIPIHARKSVPKCPAGTTATIVGPRTSEMEVLQNYLIELNTNHFFVSDWNDELLQPSNDLIFVDESIVLENRQRFKQLAFTGSHRNIFLVTTPYSLKTLGTQDFLDAFKVLFKPILPSKLISFVINNENINVLKTATLTKNDPIATLQKHTAALANFRVLCAEDNHVNQLVLQKQLHQLGIFKIDFADNGKVAIDFCEKNKYNIIFMDFNMPRMDGCDTTKALRDMGVASPIIGVTAQTLNESQYGKECGMDAILTKPTNTTGIAEALLHYYFDNHNQTDQKSIDRNIDNKKVGIIMEPESSESFYDTIADKLSTQGIHVTKIYSSNDDIPARQQLADLNLILIDTTSGNFEQLKKAQKLKNLGFSGEFYALTPVQSDLLTRTCKRYGINHSITPAKLENFTSEQFA